MIRRYLALTFSILIVAASMAYAAKDAPVIIAIEKAFLEARYDNVVADTSKALDARTGRQDELYYLKGIAQLKLRRYEDARQSFERVLTLQQQSDKALYAHIGIGDSYLFEKDYPRALEWYNKAVTRFPNDKNRSLAYARLGNCYEMLGLFDKAKASYEAARAMSPLGLEDKRFMGILQSQDKDGRQAAAAAGGTQPAAQESDVDLVLADNSAALVTLQAGCFKSKRNADNFIKKLERDGFHCYVDISSDGVKKMYRVRIGRFRSRKESEDVAAALERKGYVVKTCSGGLCQ